MYLCDCLSGLCYIYVVNIHVACSSGSYMVDLTKMVGTAHTHALVIEKQ